MIRYSTAMRNALAAGDDLSKVLADGKLFIYSGSQPATADTDIGGSVLLLAFTKDGVAYVAPTRASATLTITGSAGSIDAVKVGGSTESLIPAAGVAWDTDLTTTTDALAAAINAQQNQYGIVATSGGATGIVTLWAPYVMGADANGLTVVSTETTLAVADTNFAGGVDTVGGLNFDYPAVAGLLTKNSDVWMGTVLADGQAAWFRYVGAGSVPAGASTSDIRMDGSIATGGGDMTATTLTLTTGEVQVFSSFKLTVPAS